MRMNEIRMLIAYERAVSPKVRLLERFPNDGRTGNLGHIDTIDGWIPKIQMCARMNERHEDKNEKRISLAACKPKMSQEETYGG
jgi:hypothetical protein